MSIRVKNPPNAYELMNSIRSIGCSFKTAVADIVANILSKSSRTIQRAIATLKETNRIKRVGPDKGGHWEICK